MDVNNISEGKNHKAINIGSLDNLHDHNFVHPKFGTVDKSRIFVGELLQSTGAEISIRELAANTTIPFLHTHKKHEEIYVFLKGKGLFQVDDEIFDVEEGSIVRVAAKGKRSLKNSMNNSMTYMVIQATEGSLNDYNISDGLRVDGKVSL